MTDHKTHFAVELNFPKTVLDFAEIMAWRLSAIYRTKRSLTMP